MFEYFFISAEQQRLPIFFYKYATIRQTRLTNRQTDKCRYMQTHRKMNGKTGGLRDRWMESQKRRQTDLRTEGRTDRHRDLFKNRWTYRWTDRQTEKWTDRKRD